MVWTYFGEFQPSDKRGAALSVLATFWMVRQHPEFAVRLTSGLQVGNIAVAALAWAVIPHDIGWSDPAHFQVCEHMFLFRSVSFPYLPFPSTILGVSLLPSVLCLVSLLPLPCSGK